MEAPGIAGNLKSGVGEGTSPRVGGLTKGEGGLAESDLRWNGSRSRSVACLNK